MTGITTITQKGQITIPVAMRKALGLKPYNQVRLERTNGSIYILPLKKFADFAGSVKPRKGISILKTRELIEKNYRRF